MTEQRFRFRFAASYRLPALVFGVTASTAEVVVSEDELRVRFGLWLLHTPRSNVASVERTGGFQWLKAAGPAHLSLVDRGVTWVAERSKRRSPEHRIGQRAGHLVTGSPDQFSADYG